jgi:putative cell wall-binding protein
MTAPDDTNALHTDRSGGRVMPRTLTGRGRRPLAALAAAATGLSGIALLAPGTGNAASHREAPYIAGDPRVDNTDVYTFVSPEDPDTVTMVANWWPFQEPDGGPNFFRFDENAQYDINVDNDGDAVADIVYRWTFTSSYRNPDTFLYNTGVVESLDDEDLNFRQTYDLQVIRDGVGVTLLNDAPVAPSNVGPASMPDYAALRDEAVVDVAAGTGGSSFVGQADDSFFLDLRVFDLLYGGDLSEVGNDTLNGRNVQTIALQVPKQAVALNGSAARNPVIGVWSTTQRRSTRVLAEDGTSTESGDFVQVSRLGNPLVNEVVIPVKDKDRFNAATPANDGQFLSYVTEPEVPRLIEAIYGIPAPATPRNDLVEVFLTGICDEAPCPDTIGDVELNSLLLNQDVSEIAPAEMLRLNMSIEPTASPDRLGVVGGDLAGFPNGRRLTDDVVDVGLQVLEGELLGSANDLGDAVDSNDLPFGETFPYVALPHNSAVNQSQFTGFDRLAGEDRFDTAARIALDTFESSDTVLLASGLERNLPDALAGNYLAGFEDAPILLTTPGSLPAVTRQAIERLGAQRVVILGGTSAVSAAQADTLDDRYTVERIGGRDRYETAALIATTPPASNVTQATALVARGDQFADALVAGPIAYRAQFPILLTPPDSVDRSTQAALQELGVERVLVTGGPRAISERTAGQLADARGDDSVQVRRIAGADRQATAVALAEFAAGELGFSRLHVDLARGDLAVDALAGGPHAGVLGGVILLTVGNDALGGATRDYLGAESITLEDGHVFGGPAAVSADLLAAANDAANGDDTLQDPSKR